MRNPYVQVALTYLRRIWIGLVFGCIAIVFVGLLAIPFVLTILRSWDPQFASDLFLAVLSALASSQGVRFMLILVVASSVFLAIHVKEQFSDSRARLIPRFAKVHIAVAGSAVFVLAVLGPAVIAWIAGWDGFGFVAITLFVSIAILWASLFRWLGVLVALAFYLGIAASDGGIGWIEHGLDALVHGRAIGIAAVLFVLGGVFIYLAYRRLVCFNEEMSGYHALVQMGVGQSRRTTGMSSAGELKLLRMIGEWLDKEREMTRLIGHVRRASVSKWSRICRWQAGAISSGSAWLWSLGAVLTVQVLIWVVNAWTKMDPTPLLLLTSLCWLVVVPGMALGQVIQRTHTVGYEVLMPVERGSYLRQAGLATLLSQFHLWTATCAATLLWWLVVDGSAAAVADMLGILALSASLQVLLFGVVIWVTRYPPWFGMGLGFATMALFMIADESGVLKSAFRASGSRYWSFSVGAAVLLAVADIIVVWTAYRRWLVADFD